MADAVEPQPESTSVDTNSFPAAGGTDKRRSDRRRGGTGRAARGLLTVSESVCSCWQSWEG